MTASAQSQPSPYVRPNDPANWTRIEMLLALYNGAIQQVHQAIETTKSDQRGQAAVHRTRAAALVTAIRSGIDPNHGDLPITVDQLCEFVQYCLAEGDSAKMASALKVLRELNDGFTGIRDEANRLEETGAIPPLPTDSAVEVNC